MLYFGFMAIFYVIYNVLLNKKRKYREMAFDIGPEPFGEDCWCPNLIVSYEILFVYTFLFFFFFLAFE